MAYNKYEDLDKLRQKEISEVHIQILKKFAILEGQIIDDSSLIMGIKGKSKVQPDSIVSEPHYLHPLVRGVYKPKNDKYALSIQNNPKSKWGAEIDFSTGKWRKMRYDFEDGTKYKSDIESLKKCYSDNIPIGVIYKRQKGVNQILGLGKIVNYAGTLFEIEPYLLEEEKTEEIATNYVKYQTEKNDFTSTGSERTVLTRALTKFFRDSLLAEYDRKCAFCDLSEESYLVASHIVPYSIIKKEDPKNAMNPSNGILLCRLCDIAFEKGDLILNEKFQIEIIDKLMKKSVIDNPLGSWLSHLKKSVLIKSQSKYKINQKFLQRKIKLSKNKK